MTAEEIAAYGPKLSNTTVSGNVTNAAGDLYGNNFYVYMRSSDTQLSIENSTFSDNYGSAAKGDAVGGVIMMKGNVTFTDVIFSNNVVESKASNVMAAGGAVYADTAINTDVYATGAPNFIITKDTVYSGNNVIAVDDSAWYDTWGGLGQSSGGFLFLDRGAVAGFDIAEGVTLTIGTEDSTGNMDSIASIIACESDKKNPIINKNGLGTLQMNGDMNKYYGSLNVNAGTMNLAKDWTVRNDVTVKKDAAFNTADLNLTGLLDGLDFSNVYEEYNPDDPGDEHTLTSGEYSKETIGKGNSGANATTGGSITTEEGSSFTAGTITVNSEHAGLNINGTISFDRIVINDGSVTFGSTSHVEADVSGLGEGESLITVNTADTDAGGSGEGAATLGTGTGSGPLTIEDSATINLTGAQKGQSYQLTNDKNVSWKESNVSLDNKFLQVDTDNSSGNTIVVADDVKAVTEVYGGSTVADDVIQSAATEGSAEARKFFGETVANLAEADRAKAASDAMTLNALGGVEHGTYTMNGILADAVSGHLMNKNDQDVWAYGFHNKENVNGLSFGADYDAQYNGIAAGVDFYRKGGTTAGLALIYADSNVSGSNGISTTKNDADYYGVSLYGRFDRGSYSLLGDVSYMKGDHDITQMNKGQVITASPDSDSISVGVKAVKDYAAGENGTLTPYAGVRYLRLSTDDFTSSLGLHYEGDDQDLVIIPVGVNYTAAISHGKWSVRPYAGVGYVWTAGDRSADQTVMLGTEADSFSYDTADSGSFIARAGVTTDCGDMSYGIGYSWQKGDSVSNNAWTLSASYHF